MKTALDCLPCLLRQALYTSRLATASEATREQAVHEALTVLAGLDHDLSPPENAVFLYRRLSEICNCADPYRALKDLSTARALALRPIAAAAIAAQPSPLAAALQFAAAGNIIDYGANHDFDLDATLATCLDQSFRIDHSRQLREDLRQAETVLYLADNCGELVFDGLLIEQLGKSEKKFWLAVKERPVINDATRDDAVASGLAACATIISNGTDCPGTPLSQCDARFRDLFYAADVVISKGQGNFETLSSTPPPGKAAPQAEYCPAAPGRPVYFLLTVKCPVVAAHITDLLADGSVVRQGDTVFMKHPAG